MDAAYVILNEQVWKINDPLANTYFIKIDDQTRFIVVALLVIRTTQNRRFSAGTSRKAWKGHSQPRNARIVVTAQKMKVALTGASGRTGGLIAKKLISRPEEFEPRVIVRSRNSIKPLVEMGYDEDAIFVADIAESEKDLRAAFDGCDAVILTTSSVPRISRLSLPGVLLGKLFGKKVMPAFKWKGNSPPEMIDWIGGKNQIMAAKAVGVKKFVWLGSMGGTDPENRLNKIGDGNILQWKRRGEEFLVQSKLDYTIVHPSGLSNNPEGKRKVTVGVDDELLKTSSRQISRGDVAEVCIQSLLAPKASKRSFDICSEDGEANWDLNELLTSMVKDCNYTINSQLNT